MHRLVKQITNNSSTEYVCHNIYTSIRKNHSHIVRRWHKQCKQSRKKLPSNKQATQTVKVFDVQCRLLYGV